MITRQRANLRRAFSAQSEKALTSDEYKRLRIDEADLYDATSELAIALASAGSPIIALDLAAAEMNQAVASLQSEQLPDAVQSEQKALAALIQARKNARQILSDPKNSSASACRQVDRQQRQKPRLPKKPEKKDQQQQVNEARSKLEELARRERQWSSAAQQACQQPNSPSSQSQRDAAASDQEKSRQELNEVKQQLESLATHSQSTDEQLGQVDESMRRSVDELRKNNGDGAAEEAERSAKQLEQLSAHLASMQARDFGQRLDAAERAAQQLAAGEQSLEKRLRQDSSGESGSPETLGQKPEGPNRESLARDQQALATQMEMLAELLDDLRRDASAEGEGIRDQLDHIQAESAPRELAEGMRGVVPDLRQKPSGQVAKTVTDLRERMDELARSLGTTKAKYAQPRLKELIALEEQLAQRIDQLKRTQDRGATPGSEEAAGGNAQALQERLESLAAGDPRLANALRFQDGKEQVLEGFGHTVLHDIAGAREVAKVLQVKIQEAIVASALLDADQPVPAEYKALVEQYYKTLSDDLR